MNDAEIVRLFLSRDADAIAATAEKYGGRCRALAQNILGSEEDAEECVNDAYLSAWNSIPPREPRVLSAYMCRLTRNHALDRARRARAEKRGGGQLAAVLDELSDCVPGGASAEAELETAELARAIDAFLDTLPGKKRDIFLCRYWYAFPISQIAKKFAMRENTVSVTLARTREKLRNYLNEGGYEL